MLRLIDDLLRQPRLPRAPFTDLAPLLEAGLRTIKRRSLVFVVSDFISAPGWERPLSLLSRRHEVLAVRVRDPREVELPDVGPLIMEDAETGEQLSSTPTTAGSGSASRRRPASARRPAPPSATPASTPALSTDEDLVRAIVRMATARRRRRTLRHVLHLAHDAAAAAGRARCSAWLPTCAIDGAGGAAGCRQGLG